MTFSLHSYEEFVAGLADREYFGQKLGLERIAGLLQRLGDPQKQFQCIHIAGTNGKGSTAAMLASILQEAGYKTGLFTSPHLEDFCERIRVDGRLIGPEEVLRLAHCVREKFVEDVTFFELCTAIGFKHFAEAGVEIAVVETGLGGRLDATNVVTPLVSVITSVGMDHTQHLGETLAEIAFEKAGIIKPARPVVVGSAPAEAMEVLREQASVKKARFVPVFMNMIPPNMRIGLEGEHQRRNANLAFSVAEVLNATGALNINRDAIWRGLEGVIWPGRLETVSEEPWVILDGAHNPEAMGAVREFLEMNLEGRPLRVLFGAMADKDIQGLLAEIVPLASEIIVTSPKLKRAATAEDLAACVERFGRTAVVATDCGKALESLLEEMSMNEVLLVTGSFFLVGEARSWLAQNM